MARIKREFYFLQELIVAKRSYICYINDNNKKLGKEEQEFIQGIGNKRDAKGKKSENMLIARDWHLEIF